ncbi:hypothetical protein EVAR_86968_1 [Eumeta japonica]|uniref:Uncharacterized protein n=1 Tax=Eumeta variegata TaxID=151549 RepID=A0A4C1W9A6_EUMVA|nr:hypothetical protein EVAR_86968_1 [Eumeta japonica]
MRSKRGRERSREWTESARSREHEAAETRANGAAAKGGGGRWHRGRARPTGGNDCCRGCQIGMCSFTVAVQPVHGQLSVRFERLLMWIKDG